MIPKSAAPRRTALSATSLGLLLALSAPAFPQDGALAARSGDEETGTEHEPKRNEALTYGV